jgi:NAD(P)-dependent dehydrogenase (short-subunit alcohol dehydrogenase family)
MIGLTRYLATALGPDGVRVNCVSPGGLWTEGQDPRFIANYESRVPLGRQAHDDDVTGTIVFLASDASAYVTGVTIPVDGGWTAK